MKNNFFLNKISDSRMNIIYINFSPDAEFSPNKQTYEKIEQCLKISRNLIGYSN